jgi:hypothetical protein
MGKSVKIDSAIIQERVVRHEEKYADIHRKYLEIIGREDYSIEEEIRWMSEGKSVITKNAWGKRIKRRMLSFYVYVLCLYWLDHGSRGNAG